MARTVALALENPLAVLRHHAKSFFWASRFLPRARRLPVAQLYAFCRAVDDIADHEAASIARAKLEDLREEVGRGLHIAEFERQGLRREWLLDLIAGALADTAFAQPVSEADLDRYCYQVAGVVGLMMCPLLGVQSESAWQHAVDLGSAMQLTNIARDVCEDAERGRIYLPRAWFDALQIEIAPSQLLENGARLVRRLLEKAEPLYHSGRLGLKAIPWRTRISVAVALEIYRDIGYSLARQNYSPSGGRAFVTPWRKIYLSLKAIFNLIFKDPSYENLSHNFSWRSEIFLGAADGQVVGRFDSKGITEDPAYQAAIAKPLPQP